ncbi:hypothetical protein GOARA_023_00030 [Gordonia araii NBRC 100433]|uniref:PaaX domain-containing protein, C-domain protein n=1 Tax=Gordonia araii NBRC 100433 TaxID=1073574 RepID=G7GZC6_9ACTN|nr:PaaX family transcriptional regulator C-terminal domain-containing protein [Gordonia araii]NNG99069.1 PaaX domain-containing protein, C- domain protein [Gordonia araii NBRC 100433]GAB08951.1 hypothetical protein GOARA_023_00030 [Gordonia araii NBRC 100433]
MILGVAAATNEPAPLSARSTVLSLMLGTHPEPLTSAHLRRAGQFFDIEPGTVRVATARAVADGDLVRSDDGYRLGARLLRRQQHQAEAVRDTESPWDGKWEMAVVVVTGRSGPERAALRESLNEHRLAELKEGIWTRPANLQRPRDYATNPVLRTFIARAEQDPRELAEMLWPLPAWADEAEQLLAAWDRAQLPATRLASAARMVRHLASDPLLPSELLPADWPAETLRDAYLRYQEELRGLVRRG